MRSLPYQTLRSSQLHHHFRHISLCSLGFLLQLVSLSLSLTLSTCISVSISPFPSYHSLYLCLCLQVPLSLSVFPICLFLSLIVTCLFSSVSLLSVSLPHLFLPPSLSLSKPLKNAQGLVPVEGWWEWGRGAELLLEDLRAGRPLPAREGCQPNRSDSSFSAPSHPGCRRPEPC